LAFLAPTPDPSRPGRPPQLLPLPYRSRPWRLVHALVLATSLQLTLLAAGIGAISHLNHRRSLEALASALGQSISDQVRQELDHLLETPRLLTELNGAAIDSGQLDPENFPQLERAFQAQMLRFPVGYINYGNEQGEYLGVERLDNGDLRVNVMEKELGPRRQLVYDLGPGGRSLQPVEVYDDIGTAREEPWYSETLKVGAPAWSSIYQWDDKPEVLSISFNQPVRDRRGRPQGVIGVDLILSQLNGKLRRIWGERPGLVLIVERNGLLVASSDGQTLRYGKPGAAPTRLPLDRSPDPMVRAAATALSAGLEDHQLPPWRRRFIRSDLFLEVIPWRDRHGLDWLVLVLIPRNALAAALQSYNGLPLLFYLLVLSLAILVCSRLTGWILRPLRGVSDSATELAVAIRCSPGETLSFRSGMPPRSALELQKLGAAIQSLVASFNGLVAAQRRSSQRLRREVQQKDRALQLSLQSQQQAEACSEAHQSYLVQLSQEIRSPLRFVQAVTRQALGQPMPEEARRSLVSIGETTRRVLQLLNDAVDLSALQGGGVDLQEVRFSLAVLLQEVSDLIDQQAQLRDLALAFTIVPGTVDALVGDVRRLRQVLLQALASATLRSGVGRIEITAATDPLATGDGIGDDRRLRLCLTLRESGSAPEPLPLCEQGAAQEVGSTLGLSISQDLLAWMGGSFAIADEPGHGTTVTLSLPLRAAPSPAVAPGALCHPPAAAVRLLGRGAVAERERLGPLLAPLNLAPAERSVDGVWALVLIEAAESPVETAEAVRALRPGPGEGPPVAVLVRRLDRDAFAAVPEPPWDALVVVPLHGPRLRAALAPLMPLPGAATPPGACAPPPDCPAW
jgi:signal transduction histidine kinase